MGKKKRLYCRDCRKYTKFEYLREVALPYNIRSGFSHAVRNPGKGYLYRCTECDDCERVEKS